MIKYGDNGSYSIELIDYKSKAEVFSYSSSSIDMWQDGASFARPKWGIYRSLNNDQDLQDEIVKYSGISIEEITNSLSVKYLKEKAANILLTPNPSSEKVEFKNADSIDYSSVEFYDATGRKIPIKTRLTKNKLDVTGISKGLYFVVFKKDTITLKVLRCYVR